MSPLEAARGHLAKAQEFLAEAESALQSGHMIRTDEGQTWDAMNLAFGGVRGDGWEAQIELRRNALRAATLVERASPGDEAITKMAQALLELVKLTPLGFELLRVKNPDEALALLARGDELAKRLSGYEPIDLRRIFDLPEEL